MNYRIRDFFSGYQIIPEIGGGKADALFECGEKVPVKLRLLGDIAPGDQVTVKISDNAGCVKENVLEPEETVVFEVARSTPGFVDFSVQWHHSSERSLTEYACSVGFSVEKIRPFEEAPEDFFPFWQKLIDEAAALPEKIRMIPMPERAAPATEVFQLQVPTLNGKTIYGWISIPRKEGKYPIMAGFPGSGAAGGVREAFRYEDAITLYMEVHSYAPRPGETREETIARAGYNPFGYACQGIESRDTYFYHDVLPAVSRAVDFVQTLPQYDGKNMGFFGSSQGGWLSIMTAAFHPEVSCIFVNVPAFTQWGGFRTVQLETEKHADDHGYEKMVRETLRYYSSVYAAPRVRADVSMTVGRVDPVCPPTSVYALYNQLPGRKMMCHEMDMSHECRASWQEGVKALHDHLVSLK